MYHEEKVINGVLCWKEFPDAEWTEYTKECLTISLRSTRAGISRQAERIEELDAENDRLRAALEKIVWGSNKFRPALTASYTEETYLSLQIAAMKAFCAKVLK